MQETHILLILLHLSPVNIFKMHPWMLDMVTLSPSQVEPNLLLKMCPLSNALISTRMNMMTGSHSVAKTTTVIADLPVRMML